MLKYKIDDIIERIGTIAILKEINEYEKEVFINSLLY